MTQSATQLTAPSRQRRKERFNVALGARLRSRKMTIAVPRPRASWLSSRFLVLGFLALIVFGTLLLMLPISSSRGQTTPFIDALFTATSAVTTTGLIVVDTGSFYSLFGQIVILALFQVGGLGYMIIIVLAILGVTGRLSLNTRMMLHESVGHPASAEVVRFVKMIVVFTLLFELIGAAFLSIYWMSYFPPPRAIYLGIFHAVSAFCTAGFSLFSDSFSSFRTSPGLNVAIMALTIAGGIGFFVMYDIYVLMTRTIKGARPRGLLVHSKFVLLLSAVIMLLGAGIIFFAEARAQMFPAGERFLSSIFQSVSASTTTGFNTINIGAMTPTSLVMIIILMFIGASPGGTGGGIKTASFGVMLLSLFSFLTGRKDVNLFARRIPPETINKAFIIGLIALLWAILVILMLTVTERVAFLAISFETVSALGTVGLSPGITPHLSITGKILISITMLVGRIGPLAVGLSLIGIPKPTSFKYAEADVLVS